MEVTFFQLKSVIANVNMKKLIFLTTCLFSISTHAQTTCPSDPALRWHNCVGTYTDANGDKYVGEHQDGKFHGQGTYTYANGTIERGYYMRGEFVPEICEGMGLSKGTEAFGNCVVKLIDKIN